MATYEAQISSLGPGVSLEAAEFSEIAAYAQVGTLPLSLGLSSADLGILELPVLALSLSLSQATLRISNGIGRVQPVALTLAPQPATLTAFKAAAQLPLELTLGLESAILSRGFIGAQEEPLALSLSLSDATLRISGGIARPNPLGLSLGLVPVGAVYFQLVPFPNVAPSAIQFTPPSYPLTKSKTQQGTVVTRIWASSPGDARLALEYEVIDDTSAESILAAWDACNGPHFDLYIPLAVLGTPQGAMQAPLSLAGQKLRWRFAARPEIRSLFGGYSSVSVSLKGVSDKGMTPYVSPF